MSGKTSILGLYLPGGGSSGSYGADEQADIDRLNDNFNTLDAAVGIKYATFAQIPTPYLYQTITNSADGEQYVWNGSKWVYLLPNRLSATGMKGVYFTQDDLLNGGKLDTRYFTQADLLQNGKIDTAYLSRSKITVGTATMPASTQQDSSHFSASVNLNYTANFTQSSHVFAQVRSSSTDMMRVTTSMTTGGCVLTLVRDSSFGAGAAVEWLALSL